MNLLDVRLRSYVSDTELESKIGKIVTEADYNLLVTGPAKLAKPDGSLLAIYLPRSLVPVLTSHPYTEQIFRSLKSLVTDNRGDASGSERVRHGDEKRTRTKKVASTMIGAFDRGGPKQFCRQSAWTSKHMERFAMLYPFFQWIAEYFKVYAPAQYRRQMVEVAKTDPAWIIPGTPFTTITVNNTYPTGVHTDSGDLETGFSTLAVFRRGQYAGGHLVFPRFRVAVDMKHGDLLLMDAHEHHGNTEITKNSDDAERISVVSYFRSNMVQCGSASAEYQRAVSYAERRGGIALDGGPDRADGELAGQDARS